MAHYVYNQLMRILLPFVLWRLRCKSKKQPEYALRWNERFARKKINIPPGGVMFHVASLGETIAATPIIRAFMANNPGTSVLVTSVTPTGSKQIEKTFGDRVFHCYLPFDLPIIQRRFIAGVKPSMLVLMETELWPNLIYSAKKSDARIMVMNARLSERSAKRYAKFPHLTGAMLHNIDLIAAQFDNDAERFRHLGATNSKVVVTGNIKFDTQLSSQQISNIQRFESCWQRNSRVWMAASTHEGEEALLLDVHKRLLHKYSDAILIIVPRHPDRFDAVFDAAAKEFHCEKKSLINSAIGNKTHVVIGDTLGEMHLYISVADVCFIGGSLVEMGGHNPFEATCQGKPVIHGPHVFNFRRSYELLGELAASTQIESALALEAELLDLFDDNNTLVEMAECAQACQAEFQGASIYTVELLDALHRSSGSNVDKYKQPLGEHDQNPGQQGDVADALYSP